MQKRYVSIAFRYLITDWITRRQPELKDKTFVMATPVHGRMLVSAVNRIAEAEGIAIHTPVADAKAIVQSLHVVDELPGVSGKLLKALGKWCIRYSPLVAADPPDGLILDASGCAHLWGGETGYLHQISRRLTGFGYHVNLAMADTIGAAWALARFGETTQIIESGRHYQSLLSLPALALRLEPAVWERLQKLGLSGIGSFISMPRSVLRRRFGENLLIRLRQALGQEQEYIQPIEVIPPYLERLPCLEPIRTAAGIEIAITRLLEMLCQRLVKEGKGVRTATLKCYRMDGKVEEASIQTSRASQHAAHLFKLFELKIPSIRPGLGMELFTLEAQKVEDILQEQESLWMSETWGLDHPELAELLDRIAGKVGADAIHRYLPDEHYWPERSVRLAASLAEKPASSWPSDKPRPIHLLPKPEPVEVSAPIPDYPPMLFRYKNKLHHINKADGPERIEQEWWLQSGEHRDYYVVEDEEGQRYWLFRSGHYAAGQSAWFIHGYFA